MKRNKMNKSVPRILVADSPSHQALEGIRNLRKYGCAADIAWRQKKGLSSLVRSLSVRNYYDIASPEESIDEYVDDVLHLVNENNYQTVLPLGLNAHHALSSRLSELQPHVGVMIASYDKLALALSLIHQASVGVLRSIGTIATAAMMKAYHGDSPTIGGEHVQAVLTR
jgi:hypothetical protein